MLQKFVILWIVAITFFVTDFASAQKTARIHVNEDQSQTVTYQETGYTLVSNRCSPSRSRGYSRGYTYPRSYRTYGGYAPSYGIYFGYGRSGVYYRPYTRNWTQQLPAPRKVPKRKTKARKISNGVERSILLRPIKIVGKVSEVSYESWLKAQRDNRKDVLVGILSDVNTG